MVSPFKDWLAEQHGIDFSMRGNDFSRALSYREAARWSTARDLAAAQRLLRYRDVPPDADPRRGRGDAALASLLTW
jgi:hypothetical protein